MELPEKKNTTIQLLIKSPNQLEEDLKVDCDLGWSVGNLKDYLSDVYPTKPLRSQQKIIFCGRLLSDHLMLKEVLPQDQNVYTMHLVCSHSMTSNKDASVTTAANTADNLNSVPNVPYENVMDQSSAYAEGLRRRLLEQQQTHVPDPNAMFNPNTSFAVNNFSAIPAPYIAYQLALMQQTYAQAMAQHFAQSNPVNQANFYGSQNVTPVPPAPIQNVNPVRNQEENVNEQNVPRRAALFRDQNRNDGENENFDLLDAVYVLTRVFMLVTVLYFYSSLGRILLVLTLGLGFVLHRVATRRQNRRIIARRTREQADTDAGDIPQAGTQNNQENQEAQNDQSPAAPPPPAPQVVPSLTQTAPSSLAIAMTFVKTFFTSLMPEQYPVPDLG